MIVYLFTFENIYYYCYINLYVYKNKLIRAMRGYQFFFSSINSSIFLCLFKRLKI